MDAFELWCWRRLLRVPWTARKSNQSILKEISPECSLKGLMIKLKTRDRHVDVLLPQDGNTLADVVGTVALHLSAGTVAVRSLLDELSVLVGTRFQVLFHSPPGVLFTFPSRYSSLSVTE